jgi:hypothetical protein
MAESGKTVARVIRVDRSGSAPARPTTMSERIEAVWLLTLECMAWGSEAQDEPRLRRSELRVQRR